MEKQALTENTLIDIGRKVHYVHIITGWIYDLNRRTGIYEDITVEKIYDYISKDHQYRRFNLELSKEEVEIICRDILSQFGTLSNFGGCPTKYHFQPMRMSKKDELDCDPYYYPYPLE